MTFAHATVLLEETVDALSPHAGGVYADVTLGGAGHAEAILERSAPDGRLLGIDRDPRAIEAASERLNRFGARVCVRHGRMSSVPEEARNAGFEGFHGVVADLGVSSPQVDEAERGFSFRAEGPLDMRMDPTAGLTARELIDSVDEERLANILYEYGEERKSRRIARSIKRAADDDVLNTTEDLRQAVQRAVGRPPGRIDPATRTFQALRIAVNGELDELEALLGWAPDLICDDGVIAIISFHSLEDRMVKRAFRDDARWIPVWKRPKVPSDAEMDRNSRSRSAKLRAAKRRPRAEALEDGT